MSEASLSPRFNHPKNITVGKGRIIYKDRNGNFDAAGWVLPGGKVTQDEWEAKAAAVLLDKLSK